MACWLPIQMSCFLGRDTYETPWSKLALVEHPQCGCLIPLLNVRQQQEPAAWTSAACCVEGVGAPNPFPQARGWLGWADLDGDS